MSIRTPFVGLLAAVAVSLLTAAPARADRLCDPAAEDCRAALIDLIRSEPAGIDVAFWFMEDARYSAELIRRAQAGVPVRVLIDTTALSGNPVRAQIIESLRAAGIPIRRRNVSSILHWKMMLFAGQGQIEFSGANYSPDALVPNDPYRNYVDEAVFFTSDAELVHSFMQRYDDLWTDAVSYANYANVATPARHYPNYPLAAELNFPPAASYRDRALASYAAEPSGIDTIMYRITDRAHTDAMIAAVQRGVRVRVITEQAEYRNPARLWDAWNVDRLWMAGVEVRQRAHAGLNHQKSVILRGRSAIIFGSSNWTSPSNQSQEEHNLFTTRPWMVQWFEAQFDRKWNNTGPAVETQSFQPQPPATPVYAAPGDGAAGVSATRPVIAFNAGPFAHLYDIYLGTTAAPQLIAVNVPLGPSADGSMFSYQLPPLAPGTRYYWRVIARTVALQPAAGAVWSFTTAGAPGPAPAPLPSPAPTPTPDPGPTPPPAPPPSPDPEPDPAPRPSPPPAPAPPAAPHPAMSIDAPAEGQALPMPFVLTGWAADLAAADNGIDLVHVYAYPAGGGAPIFVGAAPVNGGRPDVGAIFGAPHGASGYGLFVRGLPPGAYTLVVFAHSNSGAGFVLSQTRNVRIESSATVFLDVPIANAVVGQRFFVGGWAADFGAASGGGIDLVHVYAYPLDGQAAGPLFLGQALANALRPDVGAAFGAQFRSTGYGLIAPPLAPGRYQVVVYGRSLVAGTFVTAAATVVTVR
jgi:phosphatidylserine/phosphatidylglycerophosphate/cardiolipin synthase-like enzyme